MDGGHESELTAPDHSDKLEEGRIDSVHSTSDRRLFTTRSRLDVVAVVYGGTKMIKQYIEKIARQHSQAHADWMEENLRRAIGPVMWWLIEHSPAPIARWLSHRTGVKTIVKTTPWGERITITKGSEELVSEDFPYNKEDEDAAEA